MKTPELVMERLALVFDRCRGMANAETAMRCGFGMSLSERAQRIDVTGHAVSAFMKNVKKRD